MAVRTFTKPSSLEERLCNGTRLSKNFAMSSKSTAPSNQDGPSSDGTFAYQDKLEKLPIPTIESTCKKYLDALKPLQSRREQSETEAAVRRFLQSDGPDLNERLKKYATGKTSYIEQFCMSFRANSDASNPFL